MHAKDLYEASYLKTNYRVLVGNSYIDFRIDEAKGHRPWRVTNECVKNWTFVSAENPNSVLLSARENALRNRMLLRYLHKRKFRYFFGIGIPDLGTWPAELGFFVINVNLLEAKRIGHKFHQNAIVFSKALKPPELIWLT
jgi:hypothetical protein